MVAAFIDRAAWTATVLTFVGLTSIGATVGITGGLSREGVVGDIMAAALGLFGALAVWLFAADRSKGAIVSICGFVFALSLFVGFFLFVSREREFAVRV